MAKTNPIGVRFDIDQLNCLKKGQNLKTAQQVVNFLMNYYFDDAELRAICTPPRALEEPPGKYLGVAIPVGLTGIDLTIWKQGIRDKKP